MQLFRIGAFLFSLLIGFFCHADDFTYAGEVLVSRTWDRLTLNSPGVNPSNQVFRLPNQKDQIDFRGELKWLGTNSKAILRPRLIDSTETAEILESTETKQRTKLDLTDAFLENHWTPDFTSTLGLQVYQWGPAEFLNPSNPLSHFNPLQKSLAYKEKGKALLRLNYSFNKENSLVFAYEGLSNQEPEWISEDNFVTKYFVKYEKSWSGTLNSVGLSMGQAEKHNQFVGEYFNYCFNDFFSIYADSKQQQNRIHFIPVANSTSYDMQSSYPTENTWSSLSIVGVRFEDSFDFRIEYIYNSDGYTKDDIKNGYAAASNFLSASYATNLSRYFKPGLELMGMNYLYMSLRITDPFKVKDLGLYFREIYSFQDESAQFQIEFEKSFFDNLTIYAGVSGLIFSLNESQSLDTSATETSEFRILQSNESFTGIKWSF